MYAIYLFREMCDLDPRASLDAAIHTRLGSCRAWTMVAFFTVYALSSRYVSTFRPPGAAARAAESEMRRESVSEYTIVHFFSVIH